MRQSSSKRILFVYNAPQSFVVSDRDLLRERWEVEEYFQPSRAVNAVALAQGVAHCDLVYAWFASWHSFLPALLARLMGKPSIVVTGGYDTANLPEAGYGSQRGGLRKLVARSVIRSASHQLMVSHSSQREAIVNANASPARSSVIPHGLDPLPVDLLEERERIILTVGSVWRENLLRKGLLPFVQTADLLPDARFVLVGRWYDDAIDVLREAAAPNVEFTGYLPDNDLHALYGRASVYVQASLHESFGMSVAESMVHGCIPVATRAGALPEVIGAAGLYMPSNNPADIAATIREALALGPDARLRARERILTNFPMDRRRQELFALVDQFLN